MIQGLVESMKGTRKPDNWPVEDLSCLYEEMFRKIHFVTIHGNISCIFELCLSETYIKGF